MKVLMISDVYFPRINGVSTSIQTFSETVSEHDIEVTLVAPEYPQAIEQARILRIPSRRVPFDPEDRLMRRQDLARLAKRLKDQHFDLVHVQTPFVAHYAGLKWSTERRIPCFATYHTHFEEYFYHYLPLLPAPFARLLTRRLARSQCNALDAVIAPSRAMRDALHKYGVTTPIHVLPTGIPMEKFSTGDRIGFRRQHGIDERDPVALYVGRVAHEKNLPFLLQALSAALKRLPKLRLVIAGEGPAMSGLKRQANTMGIAGNVLFVGYLDRQTQLPSCYAAADLFVFSSKTETQGLVLLEAMAMGLPTLGIPAMGAAEILGPEQGAVCAPDDMVGFAELMSTLLMDRPRLAALSVEAHKFAGGWAAPERARQLAELYQQLGRTR